MITWTEQTKGGCGIACIAMITGETYARIMDQYPTFCGNCGMEDDDLDHFLAELGFSVQRLWPDKAFDGTVRKPWPPKPWADLHIASVYQTLRDVDGHFVAMDKKGNVYDPADSEYTKCRLSRYPIIEWVAGVFAP